MFVVRQFSSVLNLVAIFLSLSLSNICLFSSGVNQGAKVFLIFLLRSGACMLEIFTKISFQISHARFGLSSFWIICHGARLRSYLKALASKFLNCLLVIILEFLLGTHSFLTA